MNITYLRRMYRPDGIFSVASRDDTGVSFAVVLEHAFWDISLQKYLPILQPGVYDCVRGLHRLKDMTEDFETFEITGVLDQNNARHSHLLFHWGNWNENSEGCSLLGESFSTGHNPLNPNPTPTEMITKSRATFAAFMLLQTGVNKFQLTVKG